MDLTVEVHRLSPGWDTILMVSSYKKNRPNEKPVLLLEVKTEVGGQVLFLFTMDCFFCTVELSIGLCILFSVSASALYYTYLVVLLATAYLFRVHYASSIIKMILMLKICCCFFLAAFAHLPYWSSWPERLKVLLFFLKHGRL